MTFSLEQLSVAYPHQIWLEFDKEQEKQALPLEEDYSHDAAYQRAFLNRLCLNILVPALAQEANKQPRQKQANPQEWEFVNGTAITIGEAEIVLIPSIAIDTEEFCVPQEWVDIPEWAADYYLAVQVNLEDRWLRVWGFTTHRHLKTQGRYDASDSAWQTLCDRTYCLDAEDLWENLNVMWVSLELCREEKATITQLPTLSAFQAERLLAQLSQPSPYSPRLMVPFAQWAALLASPSYRQQLYQRRIGKKPVVNLSQWFEKVFPQRWLSLEDLVRRTESETQSSLSFNLSYSRMASRSGDSESASTLSPVSRGRVVDLGIQLADHPVALIVYLTPESDTKRNILLQVHPGGSKTYLPPGVQLIVLDESGEIFLEAQSRTADNWIQLEFRGEPGERFSVKVALGDASIREEFII